MNVDRLYKEYIQIPMDLGTSPEEVIKDLLITSETNRDHLRKASEEIRNLENSRAVLYKRVSTLEKQLKALDNSDDLFMDGSILILEKP
ncbi:hypothetical protein [Vibrio owensii]|uniref:hypothetical protein n=1 Tax=Vibrio owensii TaxID=696485 RepID=UPI00406973A5